MTEKFVPSETETRDNNLPSNLSLTIYFSRHLSRGDLGNFEDFEQSLRSSDVYIPETLGWTQKDLNIYRQISQGDRAVLNIANDHLDRYQYPNKDFQKAVNQALFKSHVRVVFADIPKESPAYQRQLDVMTIDPNDIFAGQFEDGLDYLANHYRGIKAMRTERDAYITNNVGVALRSEIQSVGKLRKRSTINALMTIGSDHVAIGETISQAALHAREATGNNLPEVNVRKGEVTDDYLISEILNGDKSQEDMSIILARRLVQVYTLKHVLSINPTASSVDLENGINSLTMEEMENVFNFLKASHFRNNQDARKYFILFEKVLKQISVGGKSS